MNDYEYEVTMLNKLLNKMLKKECEEFSAIRVHPLNYISNRENFNVYSVHTMVVSIKLKKTPTILEKLLIRNKIIALLNTLLNFIGVYMPKPIEDIKLRFI